MLRAQGHGSDFQRRIQHGVQICVQYMTLLVEKKTLIQCLGETVQHSYNNKTIPPTDIHRFVSDSGSINAVTLCNLRQGQKKSYSGFPLPETAITPTKISSKLIISSLIADRLL